VSQAVRRDDVVHRARRADPQLITLLLPVAPAAAAASTATLSVVVVARNVDDVVAF